MQQTEDRITKEVLTEFFENKDTQKVLSEMNDRLIKIEEMSEVEIKNRIFFKDKEEFLEALKKHDE